MSEVTITMRQFHAGIAEAVRDVSEENERLRADLAIALKDIDLLRATLAATRLELDRALVRMAEESRMKPVCTWAQDDDGDWTPGCTSDEEYDDCHKPHGDYCPHCGHRRKNVPRKVVYWDRDGTEGQPL